MMVTQEYYEMLMDADNGKGKDFFAIKYPKNYPSRLIKLLEEQRGLYEVIEK